MKLRRVHPVLGTYTHAVGECRVDIFRRMLKTEAQTTWAVEESWVIEGLLLTTKSTSSSARADIAAKMTRLERAYSLDGGDIYLMMPDGGISANYLLGAGTLGGIRVSEPPSYPEGTGAEGATKRKYQIRLIAIRPLATRLLDTAYKSFEESVSYSGGGQEYGHIQPRVGPGVKQLLTRNLTFRAVQRGSSVKIHGGYGPVPSPIWPSAVRFSEPLVTDGHPEVVGNDLINWPRSWQWEFEATYRLVGQPHIWRRTT